jgi:hypothetical protein
MALPKEERWAQWDNPGCADKCYDPEPGDERPHCWKRKPPATDGLDPGPDPTVNHHYGEDNYGYGASGDDHPTPPEEEAAYGGGDTDYKLPDDYDPDKPYSDSDVDNDDNYPDDGEDDEEVRRSLDAEEAEASSVGDTLHTDPGTPPPSVLRTPCCDPRASRSRALALSRSQRGVRCS